jgi:hypothetical protein
MALPMGLDSFDFLHATVPANNPARGRCRRVERGVDKSSAPRRVILPN